MKLYFFGWPGLIGGADTKLAHLLPLLRTEFDIMVVPTGRFEQFDSAGRRYLDKLKIPYAPLHELPARLGGWGIALCNGEFLSSGEALEARRRGLRLAWSNEMTCLFPAERGALTLGLFDTVLYVSDAQRQLLEPHYRRILNGELGLRPFNSRLQEPEGWIPSPGRKLRWVMTGNYIDPREFPFRQRWPHPPERPLVIGRLSRPDPVKFPLDFPGFYESLGLRHARFRVMGWSRQLAAQWPSHVFDTRWDLLAPLAETSAHFLQSLDLLVYSLHPACRESWGRAVVEAMLTGAIPLVPAGREHHLESLISHGESGFVCEDPQAFGRFARLLENSPELRREMSGRARARAAEKLCDPGQHLACWRRVFRDTPPPATC